MPVNDPRALECVLYVFFLLGLIIKQVKQVLRPACPVDTQHYN
jgi:hypothetical protein